MGAKTHKSNKSTHLRFIKPEDGVLKPLLGATDLFERLLKNSIKIFVVGNAAAQDFTDVFNVFNVDN